MKNRISAVLFSTMFCILVLVAAYDQRGYWAVGAEVLLPVMLFIVLITVERES